MGGGGCLLPLAFVITQRLINSLIQGNFTLLAFNSLISRWKKDENFSQRVDLMHLRRPPTVRGRFAIRRLLPCMMAMILMASLSRQALAFHTTASSRRCIANPSSTASFLSSFLSTVSSKARHVRLFSATTDLTEEQKVEIEEKIKSKGDEIRILKEGGAEKAAIAPLVAELLALKAQLDPSLVKQEKSKPQKQNQQQQQKKEKQQDQKQQPDDAESDFITARSVDYSKWYNDLIRVVGLAETSPVRGCMVIKPWGMSLWDRIRNVLDAKIQEHGAENAYFPLLIPKSFLSKEAEHVDGFAKECAVVTHHRLTTGENGLIVDPEAELEEPLIIRPTSETMIWFMFRKWINSHR
jgi:hypothetical protein